MLQETKCGAWTSAKNIPQQNGRRFPRNGGGHFMCLQRPFQFESTCKSHVSVETDVGSGSVRSYISIVMSLLEIVFKFLLYTRQSTSVVFDGAPEHKLPMANPLLCQTGFFEAVGKMIGHSISLHI